MTESDSNHSNPFKFHACDTFILIPSCAGAPFRPMAAFALQNEGPRNKMHHFSPKSHEMRGKAMTSLWHSYESMTIQWPSAMHQFCKFSDSQGFSSFLRRFRAKWVSPVSEQATHKQNFSNKTRGDLFCRNPAYQSIATHWQHALATKFCWLAKAQSHHFSVGSLEKLEWKSSLIIAHRNLQWPPGKPRYTITWWQSFNTFPAIFPLELLFRLSNPQHP